MRRSILFILTIFISSIAFSQEEDSYVLGDKTSSTSNTTEWKITDKFDWHRVTVGGGLGATFGTITYIEIAPTFGYYLTKNIVAGVGANYTYYSDNDYNYSTSIYGGRIFGEYVFPDLPLLAHVEGEVINLAGFANKRINIYNVYVGGGIKQSLGPNSYIFILGLWNLNETKESSYYLQPNPIIRGGIAIGI